MRKLLYILIFVSASIARQSVAQNTKIDSLLTLIKSDKEDTNKVMHLHNLCKEYQNTGDYKMALYTEQQTLTLAQKLNYKKFIAISYNSIGLIYNNQGNLPEALKSYFSALKIYEGLNYKEGVASCYGNIGNIYGQQGNNTEALKNFFSILKIYQQLKNRKGIAYANTSIGTTYFSQNNYPEALKYYLTSLTICKEIGDEFGISDAYNGLGIVYYNQGNYPKALETYFASLKIKESIDDKEGIATCLINLGELYTKLNKTKEAENYLNKALQLNIELSSKDGIKYCYEYKTVIDSMNGNYKEAFEHHKLFITYKDSLDNEETKKKSLQSVMQYEFDKKEIATKAEQDKLDAINAEEKKKQQIVIYAVAGLLILVGVFAVFMYNRFRITNRQKVIIEVQKQRVDKAYEELHEKNKEVMDSIRYAKRIQTALITSEKYITNSLNRLMKK